MSEVLVHGLLVLIFWAQRYGKKHMDEPSYHFMMTKAKGEWGGRALTIFFNSTPSSELISFH